MARVPGNLRILEPHQFAALEQIATGLGYWAEELTYIITRGGETGDSLYDIAQGAETLGDRAVNGQTWANKATLATTGGGPGLTAADVGSTVTITVAEHERALGGVTDTYSSGTITGLNFNTEYFIYVDDDNYGKGTTKALTYAATTSKSDATNGSNRLTLRSIITPSDGGSDTTIEFDDVTDAETGASNQDLTLDAVAWANVTTATGTVATTDETISGTDSQIQVRISFTTSEPLADHVLSYRINTGAYIDVLSGDTFYIPSHLTSQTLGWQFDDPLADGLQDVASCTLTNLSDGGTVLDTWTMEVNA